MQCTKIGGNGHHLMSNRLGSPTMAPLHSRAPSSMVILGSSHGTSLTETVAFFWTTQRRCAFASDNVRLGKVLLGGLGATMGTVKSPQGASSKTTVCRAFERVVRGCVRAPLLKANVRLGRKSGVGRSALSSSIAARPISCQQHHQFRTIRWEEAMTIMRFDLWRECRQELIGS
jgi:hypothetical protein